MNVEVLYGQQKLTLPLLVIKRNGPSLLGRDWLSQLKLNWREINTLMGVTIDEILAQHKEVFQEGLEPVHTSTIARFGPVRYDKIHNVNAPSIEPYRTEPAQLIQPSRHGTVRLLLKQHIKVCFSDSVE